MAKKTTYYYKDDADIARSFMRRHGLLTGRHIGDKDLLRQANKARRIVEAGGTPDKRDLRGHRHAPEHGNRNPADFSRLSLSQRPKKHTGSGNLHRRPHGRPHQTVQFANGDRAVRGTTKVAARAAIGVSAQINENIKLVIRGTDGKTHVLGQKGGITQKYLQEVLSGHRTMRSAIDALVAYFYKSSARGWSYDGGEVEFYMSAR